MDSSQQSEGSHSNPPRAERDKNPKIVLFDDDDVQEGVQECENSVIGKIITKKVIHLNSLTNALSRIWSSPKGFKVESLGEQVFQFFFQDSKEVDRVIKGSPWLFRNSWLILQQWKRGVDPLDISFSSAPVWIQIWGLPLHCRTKKMGIKIGKSFGPVLDADVFEIQGRGSFVKVQVQLVIDKPLLHGINVGSRKDGVFWVELQYERIPQFCYSCGIIGHEDSGCEAQGKVAEDTRSLGPWMKASHFGRRIHVAQDQSRRDKEESSSGSIRRSKELTKELMEQLNRLSMKDPVPVETSITEPVLSGQIAMINKLPIESPSDPLVVSEPLEELSITTPTAATFDDGGVLQDCTNVTSRVDKEGKKWKRAR
ncbi:Zinc knuckle CX2CX4HX4C [Sesbania bispinosa]|nr:Zinc knuckle CX2CX4HX4C [Sesbania bispinosa]